MNRGGWGGPQGVDPCEFQVQGVQVDPTPGGQVLPGDLRIRSAAKTGVEAVSRLKACQIRPALVHPPNH